MVIWLHSLSDVSVEHE